MINFSGIGTTSEDFCSFFLLKQSLVITLSSFSMGYQLGILNTTESQLCSYFAWGRLNWVFITLASSLFCVGAGLGALISGKPTNYFGRRRCLLATNFSMVIISFLVKATKTLIPIDYFYLICRFLMGVCIGVCSSVPPIFINELAPRNLKNQLGIFIQMMISFGIFASFFVGWVSGLVIFDTFWNWAFPYLFPVIPIALQSYFFLIRFKLDTPKWLLCNSRQCEAESVLKKIYLPWAWQQKLNELEADQSSSRMTKDLPGILTKSLERPTCLAYVLCIFQQLSGVNVLIFYSDQVFRKFEDFDGFSIYLTLILGFCNFLFVLPCFFYNRWFGRKALLLQGFLGMFGCYAGLIAFSYFDMMIQDHWVIFVLIVISIYFYETSLGTFVWIFVTELMSFRWVGRAICVQWICAACISGLYPVLFKFNLHFDFKLLYMSFALSCAIGFIVIYNFTINVKGSELESIIQKISSSPSLLQNSESSTVRLSDQLN